MYDQDTVRIHVENSSHLQIRLIICILYLLLESVLVLQPNLNFYNHFYAFLSDFCNKPSY